jgi:hypothetical protein
MRRTWSVFLILFLLFFESSLFAQQDPEADEEYPESEWIEIITAPYVRGDKNFVISLGVLIPTYFGGSGIEKNQNGLSAGGTMSLAFNYFLNQNVFAGGEISGSFSATRGGNMLYIIPFGFRLGYQFLFRRFEFPISLLIGAAGESYLEKGYMGPFLKPGASVFWRFSPEWSFGLNVNWWFVPQWPANDLNVYGNFLELTLAARYHF